MHDYRIIHPLCEGVNCYLYDKFPSGDYAVSMFTDGKILSLPEPSAIPAKVKAHALFRFKHIIYAFPPKTFYGFSVLVDGV